MWWGDKAVEKVICKEAIRAMKQEKAAGLSKITMEMITAEDRIAEAVMLQLCILVLDERIPDEWKQGLWCQFL